MFLNSDQTRHLLNSYLSRSDTVDQSGNFMQESPILYIILAGRCMSYGPLSACHADM